MADLEDLRARIDAMSPSDRLRLAAELIDAGKHDLAHTIAERTVIELGAARALRMVRRG